MKDLELSIIIVNFNTAHLLDNCLKSVYQALRVYPFKSSAEIIVIDNGSKDRSVALIKKKFPGVLLVANKENLGFAKANNQGILKSKGQYILLLNSDTQIDKKSIKILLDRIKNNKGLGVVGSGLFNFDGSIQPSAGFSPSLLKVFLWMSFVDDIPYLSLFLHPYHVEEKNFYHKTQNVDWVTGACMLVRREAINKAGLLDENIFMYGEEVEWCYRIKKAGFSVQFFPKAKVFHHKGKSSKEEKNAGIIKEFLAILYFFRKYKPQWQQHLLKFILKFGAFLRIILFGIIIKNSQKKYSYAEAYKMVG